MKQILNRKLLALILCIVILVTLCGCQKKTKQLDNPPLDDESVAYLESVFGMTPDDIIAELGLSEKEYEEKIPPGLVYINEPITIVGKEFTKALVFTSGNVEKAKINGLRYSCDCEDAEETAEVAEALYLAAVEEYGKAKHEHGVSPSYLDNEGVFDEIRKAESGGWYIGWLVGEFSLSRINVRIEEGKSFIELEYFVLPEEWHRFEPGHKSTISLGPSFR